MSKRALLLAALLAGGGCGHAPPPPAETTVPTPDELTLGPGDTFDVRVFGEPDLSNTYRVGIDGTIDYPLIGNVKVEGLEPHQAAELIQQKLAEKYLKHPQVSILVKEQPSKKIRVIGQVAKPGTYPYQPNMSVIEAITIAGGFTPIASKNKVTITRVEKGKEVTVEAHVADIAEGQAQDIAVRPSDTINVPERIF